VRRGPGGGVLGLNHFQRHNYQLDLYGCRRHEQAVEGKRAAELKNCVLEQELENARKVPAQITRISYIYRGLLDDRRSSMGLTTRLQHQVGTLQCRLTELEGERGEGPKWEPRISGEAIAQLDTAQLVGNRSAFNSSLALDIQPLPFSSSLLFLPPPTRASPPCRWRSRPTMSPLWNAHEPPSRHAPWSRSERLRCGSASFARSKKSARCLGHVATSV
jgi:hypothetical protein